MNQFTGGSSGGNGIELRQISDVECARRIAVTIRRKGNPLVWMIGAGASVSSGIDTAAVTTRGWLKELKYLEEGDESDIDEWAARRFPNYDRKDPGSVYFEVFHAVFPSEEDRRREIERLMGGGEPGFAYATLSQLASHSEFGELVNTVISVNFDNLMAEALQIYSQRHPQIFTHESLSRSTPLPPKAPTVLKLAGDAHLRPMDPRQNRPTHHEDVTARVREKMIDAGLVIIGYSGRDECILSILESLPPGRPIGNIFWVNPEPPSGPIFDWLQERGAMWVRSGDFDDFMYCMRCEMGLGHPKIDRLEGIFRKYEAQFRDITTRAGRGLPNTPASNEKKPGVTGETGLTLKGASSLAVRRETPESRRERMRQSFTAVSKALASKRAADGVDDFADDDDAASPSGDKDALVEAAALELSAGGRANAENDGEKKANAQQEAPKAKEAAKESADDTSAQEAPAKPPKAPVADVKAPTPIAPKQLAPQENRKVKIHEVSPGAPKMPKTRLQGEELKKCRREFEAFLQEHPTNPANWAYAGAFLSIGARDMTSADEAFERAVEIGGDTDTRILCAYANFAMLRQRDHKKAGHYFLEALSLNRYDPDTLVDYAMYRQNFNKGMEEVEACFRMAVEKGQTNPKYLLAYAHFLNTRLGRREAAEPYFRRAANTPERNVEAEAEYALFRAHNTSQLDSAAKSLAAAEKHAPQSAVVAYARGVVLEMKGQNDEAEAAYKRAVELDPGEKRAQLALAKFLYARRKDTQAAVAQYRAAIRALPDYAEPRSAYAVFLEYGLGDAIGAEAQHRDAVTLEPNNPFVLAAYADHIAKRGDMAEEADTMFAEALSLCPRSVEILRSYARFLVKAGADDDRAEAVLRAAVEIDHQGWDTLEELADFLFKVRKDSEEAELYYRAALQYAPVQSSLRAKFVEFLQKTRASTAEIEQSIRSSLSGGSCDSQSLSAGAMFLLSQGRQAEGMKMLDDAFVPMWKIDQSQRPHDQMLLLWLLRFAHDANRKEEAWQAIEHLLLQGVRCEGLDLNANIEAAEKNGYANIAKLRDLIAVATGEKPVSALRRHGVKLEPPLSSQVKEQKPSEKDAPKAELGPKDKAEPEANAKAPDEAPKAPPAPDSSKPADKKRDGAA